MCFFFPLQNLHHIDSYFHKFFQELKEMCVSVATINISLQFPHETQQLTRQEAFEIRYVWFNRWSCRTAFLLRGSFDALMALCHLSFSLWVSVGNKVHFLYLEYGISAAVV